MGEGGTLSQPREATPSLGGERTASGRSGNRGSKGGGYCENAKKEPKTSIGEEGIRGKPELEKRIGKGGETPCLQKPYPRR